MGWFGTTMDDPWAWLRGGRPDPMADPSLAAGMSAGAMGGPPPYGPGLPPGPLGDPARMAGILGKGDGLSAESAPRITGRGPVGDRPLGAGLPSTWAEGAYPQGGPGTFPVASNQAPAPPTPTLGMMGGPSQDGPDPSMGGYTPPAPMSPFGGHPPMPMAKPIFGGRAPAPTGPMGGYTPPAPPGFMGAPQDDTTPMGGYTPPAPPGWGPAGPDAHGGTTGGGSQSMFPVRSDPNPILGNISKGWKAFTNYLGGPISGQAGDENSLLGYKPVSRMEAIGQTLLGAGRGVLSARGPYSNPLGYGLQGAAEGLAGARQEDTQRRQGAVQDQYKQMAGMVQMANAKAALAKAQGANVAAVNPGQQLIDKTTGQPIANATPDTTVVNGQLVNKQTGERIGAPVAPQATNFEGAAVNAMGGTLPGQAAQKYFGAKLQEMTKPTATQVALNPAFQIGSGAGKYQDTKGEGAAKELLAYNDAATTAQASKANIQVMRQLQGTTETGAGQDQLMQLRRLAVAAGVATPETAQKLGAQEAFNAVASQNVRSMLGGKLGSGISNADVGFATRMTANLGNEPAANNAILGIQDKLADRNLQIADQAAEWDRQNADRGGLFGKNTQGQTWREYINNWSEKNPLFDEDFKKQLQSGLGGGSKTGADFSKLGLQ